MRKLQITPAIHEDIESVEGTANPSSTGSKPRASRTESRKSHKQRAEWRAAGASRAGRAARQLGKLGRFDEARESLKASLAIKRLYGHPASPWMTWSALEDVERQSGRPEAANDARRQVLQTYRAYRSDGGEPMSSPTRAIALFGHTLRTSDPNAARALLPDPAKVPAQFSPALRALHAIIAGSRDPALADDPALHPFDAVELALLLESLPPADPTSPPPPALP